MRNQDSLELLDRQDRILEQLFEAWRSNDPEGCDRGSKTTANWEQGTVAKLILEQGALRIAALEDVVRTLRLCHQGELAEEAGNSITAAKLCLDRIDECSRGVTALDLRYSSTLKESIEKLRNLWIEDMQRERCTHRRPLLKRWDPGVSGCAVPYTSVPMHPSIHPYINGGTTRSR